MAPPRALIHELVRIEVRTKPRYLVLFSAELADQRTPQANDRRGREVSGFFARDCGEGQPTATAGARSAQAADDVATVVTDGVLKGQECGDVGPFARRAQAH